MIETTLSINKEILKLKITGHAGYDMIGKDIVCAGVSSLAQALAMSFEKEKRKGFYKQIGDGEMVVQILLDEDEKYIDTAMAQVFMVTDFIDALHSQYPDNVAKVVMKVK